MFGSHIPILVKILERTDGKVLDLGMGISTFIIHAMAKQTKRKVVSYETYPSWYREYTSYQTDWHDIRLVNDWDKADIDNDFWDVALVDHHPAKRRQEEVRRLANNCNYILLHDSDIFSWHYKGTKIYDLFKYKYNYDKCSPNTMVLSNFKDLSDL